MSGLSAPKPYGTESWSTAAARWLKVIAGCTAVVSAVTLGLALYTGGADPDRMGRWLVAAACLVGGAGLFFHWQSLGFVDTYDFPHRAVDGTRIPPTRIEGYETVLLAAAVTAILLLAGFAFGAGR